MKQWVKTRMETAKDYFIMPRKKALAYALMIFICLLVIWHFVGDLFENRLMQEERLQIANRVNTIGTSLTLAVNQRLTITTSVHSYISAEIKREDSFSIADPDEKLEVDNYISEMYKSISGIRNIAIAPDGVMEYVYPHEENKSVLGYKPVEDERPYVREEVSRAMESGEIVLSLPYELIQGGQGLIARKAIYDDERYWGLANVVLDMPPLLEEAGISPMPEGLNLAIADQSGKVFSGSADIFNSDPIMYLVELPEGNWMLAAIPTTGWGVRYRSIMWIYNGLGVVTVIAIPLIVYLFVNRRERLAHEVDQRTRELALSNQTLINVLEGIDADVYVADLNDYEILFANRHIRESFDNNLIGNICYEVFRNESKTCTHCLNHKLLDSNGQPTGVHAWEAQNPVTKRWYKNADRAIRWHDGRYVHLQIATDITERKRADDELKRLVQEKDILLAEVHHRVKNNMQVIISLLGLQAGEIGDESIRAVYEESRNRIKSMTLIHEQLYRSKEYARIEIGAYIDQLATTLFNSYQIEPDRVQLHITAEDVYIDLERAIPCGLLLNELITNSLKYAFPRGENGRIWIKFQPYKDTMSLVYQDNGIGLPAGLNWENAQSLGLQLVRLLSVHDLHGSVELKNGHKKGVKFLIKFPTSEMESEQNYPA